MTDADALEQPLSLCEAAYHLAEAVTRDLESTGAALVVWSGGASPRRLVPALSTHEVDWTRVKFLLSDERCVPVQSPQSNRGEMLRYLAGTPLESASIEVLPDCAQGLEDSAARIAALLSRPACASVLGIGTDGHIASLFPGGTWSKKRVPSHLIYDERGPGDCARVSLSPSALHRSRLWLVFVNSPVKRAQWSFAAQGADPAELPCALAFTGSAPPVRVIG